MHAAIEFWIMNAQSIHYHHTFRLRIKSYYRYL